MERLTLARARVALLTAPRPGGTRMRPRWHRLLAAATILALVFPLAGPPAAAQGHCLPSVPLSFRLDLTTFPRALRGPRPVGLGSSYLPWNAWEWPWGDR